MQWTACGRRCPTSTPSAEPSHCSGLLRIESGLSIDKTRLDGGPMRRFLVVSMGSVALLLGVVRAHAAMPNVSRVGPLAISRYAITSRDAMLVSSCPQLLPAQARRFGGAPGSALDENNCWMFQGLQEPQENKMFKSLERPKRKKNL